LLLVRIHGNCLLLVRRHGKCLLLARIHGNCLLIPLTWKARSVPSRFPLISISIERVSASCCLAMDYSGFQASCYSELLHIYVKTTTARDRHNTDIYSHRPFPSIHI
jgi:hypothetical protein